ncbi:c-type cytochrome [Roseomonas sp. SSH11]|uniref:C-type cytochrome n=1 Tax=Pararoseomonas baculiformis TaxID=2820812 RepID=A0ABS4AKH0_9PROT|nr:c-type cytochrome [Pararoseomonas baculiformis]
MRAAPLFVLGITVVVVAVGAAVVTRPDIGRPQGPPPGLEAARPAAAPALVTSSVSPVAARSYGLPPSWGARSHGRGEADLLHLGRAVVLGGEGPSVAGGDLGGWACHSCHGLTGEGNGAGAFPRLSGQASWYLYKQLADYASGRRQNAVMTPIARALSEGEREAVAAWYAAQGSAPAAPRPRAEVRDLQLGGALSAVGVPERGIHACVNCHGAEGRGMGPSYPALAGQYAAYTALQLRAYRSGTRGNSPLNVMAAIAANLTDAEIEALAVYFAALGPEPAR